MKPSVLSTLLPLLQRAQAGAAAEVRDDHAAVGDLRRDLRQHRRDVLVREPVEAVALHARVADLARQRHQLGDRGLAAMEAGVEARDLRHVRAAARAPPRSPRGCTADAAARAGSARADPSSTSRRHDVGPRERGAAVDDAMADAEHARAAVAASRSQAASDVERAARRRATDALERLVDERLRRRRPSP